MGCTWTWYSKIPTLKTRIQSLIQLSKKKLFESGKGVSLAGWSRLVDGCMHTRGGSWVNYQAFWLLRRCFKYSRTQPAWAQKKKHKKTIVLAPAPLAVLAGCFGELQVMAIGPRVHGSGRGKGEFFLPFRPDPPTEPPFWFLDCIVYCIVSAVFNMFAGKMWGGERVRWRSGLQIKRLRLRILCSGHRCEFGGSVPRESSVDPSRGRF